VWRTRSCPAFIGLRTWICVRICVAGRQWQQTAPQRHTAKRGACWRSSRDLRSVAMAEDSPRARGPRSAVEGAGTTPRCCRGSGLRQRTGRRLIAAAASVVFRYVTELPTAKPATIAPWPAWVFEGSGDLLRCFEEMVAWQPPGAGSRPVPIGSRSVGVSLQPAIPRRVAPQQSPLPLRRSPTIAAQSRSGVWL
jgi:hypothetical protein